MKNSAVDGNWGEWTKWSEPTGLVNPELIKRTRKCDSPAAEFGGLPCVGSNVETKEVFTRERVKHLLGLEI